MRLITVAVVFCSISLFGCSSKESVAPKDTSITIPPHLNSIEPALAIPIPTASPTPKPAREAKPEAVPTPATISNEEADELIQTREDLWKELIGE